MDDATPDRRPAWVGACGIVAPAVGLGAVAVAAGSTPGFDWVRHNLSDLGVGPAAGVFNAGLVLAGLLGMAFAFGARERFPAASLADAGLGLAAVGFACLALVGVLTLETGVLHAMVAVGFLALAPGGVALAGAGWLRLARVRFGAFSLAAGAVALASLAPASAALGLAGLGLAVPETAVAVTLGAWSAGTGARLLWARPRGARRPALRLVAVRRQEE